MTNDWLILTPLCPCPETTGGGVDLVPIVIIIGGWLVYKWARNKKRKET